MEFKQCYDCIWKTQWLQLGERVMISDCVLIFYTYKIAKLSLRFFIENDLYARNIVSHKYITFIMS